MTQCLAHQQSVENFKRSRAILLSYREDHHRACQEFRWPELTAFNWALDWFDGYAQGNHNVALWIVDRDDQQTKRTFHELSEDSSRVANFLRSRGLERGDRLLFMLPNVAPLWQLMLGAMKLGVVVVPTSLLATEADLRERIDRGNIRFVVTNNDCAEKFERIPGGYKRCCLGNRSGWITFEDSYSEPRNFSPEESTPPDDPCLLYFTSGTTAQPKLVLHTHRSYPVGHLSTMYWMGLREGDTHQNISSPGWAKHAWSSFFAPWNAGATIFTFDPGRFQPARTVDWLRKARVNSLCAPPTAWRMLVREPLGTRPPALQQLVSAGEPLDPETMQRVRREWGLMIRDGYGQTETTAQIGNTIGQPIKPGSMGKPLPGFEVSLVDDQIAISLKPKPAGIMLGYADDDEKTAHVMADGFYRTGDKATIDADGYVHFVGRADDVFKSSGYRISPFELERVLIEHAYVAEAAVVPSLDQLRHAIPKGFVVLMPGVEPTADIAESILTETNAKLAEYKRIRRIEFAELPKTISGKIRRAELRELEVARYEKRERAHREFRLEDFSCPREAKRPVAASTKN
jgi:acetyl-CoA synthetase